MQITGFGRNSVYYLTNEYAKKNAQKKPTLIPAI